MDNTAPSENEGMITTFPNIYYEKTIFYNYLRCPQFCPKKGDHLNSCKRSSFGYVNLTPLYRIEQEFFWSTRHDPLIVSISQKTLSGQISIKSRVQIVNRWFICFRMLMLY